MPFINTGNKRNKGSYYSYMFISNIPLILSKGVARILLVLNVFWFYYKSYKNLFCYKWIYGIGSSMVLGQNLFWLCTMDSTIISEQ